MDWNKLGLVVLLIGLIIAGYGAVQLAMNRPGGAGSGDPDNWEEAFQELGKAIDEAIESPGREARRRDAKKILLVGGGIALLGIGLRLSPRTRA